MSRTKTPASKSDRMRTMFRDGKSIAAVAEATRSNYAFVYGVAKRLAATDPGFDLRTVAGERKRRAVRVGPTGQVSVAVTTGWILITPDGTIKRSKTEPEF